MTSTEEKKKVSCFGKNAEQLQELLSNRHVRNILPCGYSCLVIVDEDDNYFVAKKKDDHEWQCKPCKLTEPIEKVCASMFRFNTFWIDSGRDLYAFGENTDGQLGLRHRKKVNKPQKVMNMQRVMSVASGDRHSICLCASVMTPLRLMFIVAYWVRVHCNGEVEMPSELVSVIGAYNKDLCHNRVFGAGWNNYGQYVQTRFNLIHHLHQPHINIVQVACGEANSLFLSEIGDVYVCGVNTFGQLGLGHTTNDKERSSTTRIPYFVNENIKIINIQCGFRHSLCLDEKGIVYAFGANIYGQCGVDSNTKERVTEPTPIALQAPTPTRTPMTDIKCGRFHSYCRSVGGGHYLFGKNNRNQCLKEETAVVFTPLKINDKFKSIKKVFLGGDITFVTN